METPLQMNLEQIEFKRRGLLLVVSAPSGCGKSAVLRGVLGREQGLTYSVSVTSRKPRAGEADGVDYHFVERERFEELANHGAFYEWAEVHGNLYGTRIDTVEEALEAGRDIALDIDVQGGLAVKRRSPDAVLVFLLPPSCAVLEGRLRGRATETEEAVRLRLTNAKMEMQTWPQYDYVLVNDDLEETIEGVRQIIHAERRRTSRLQLKG